MPSLHEYDVVTLYSSDSMTVNYFSLTSIRVPKEKIYLAFDPAFSKASAFGFAGNFFIKNGFDFISFVSVNNDWYQSLPVEVVDSVLKYISSPIYSRRVAYGSSMGGGACFLFSKIFRCDQVVAFSPRLVHDEQQVNELTLVRDIKVWNFPFDISCINDDCTYHVIYDDQDHLDFFNFQAISEIIPNTILKGYKFSYAGHPAIEYLKWSGDLSRVVLGLFKGAVIDVKALLSNKANSPLVNFNFAKKLFSRGRFRQALHFLDRAIKLDRDAADFHALKAKILINLGEFDVALLSAVHAYKLNPLDFNLILDYAYICKKNNFKDQALTLAMDAYEINSNSPYVLSFLADLHFDRVEYSLAVNFIERAILLIDDPDIFFQASKINLALGNLSEARAAILKAISLNPKVDFIKFQKKIDNKF